MFYWWSNDKIKNVIGWSYFVLDGFAFFKDFLDFGLKTEVDFLVSLNARDFNLTASRFWVAGLPHVHFVPTGLFGSLLAYWHVFHDFPFDCPAQRLLFGWNVIFEFVIALDNALLSEFSFLGLLDLFSDFLEVGRIFLFELFDDGFEFVDFCLKRLNVLFFVDGFLDFDFEVFWRPREKLVVLDDFSCELAFEVLLGLAEGSELLF